MQEYWTTVAPPLDTIVAGFMGWKPDPFAKRRSKAGQATGGSGEEYGNLNDLLKMFPGGTIQ